MTMNLKQYQFLYNLLQKLIQEQLVERGGQTIGRWPIYELYNKVQEQLVEGEVGYSIRQICQFFDVVLQHNKDLLIRMVSDAKLNLHELKTELESIEIMSDKGIPLEDHELEETIIPTPDESVVDEILNTLFDTTTSTPTEPELVLEESVDVEPAPTTIKKDTTNKEEEVMSKMSVDKRRLLRAEFQQIKSELYMIPSYKEKLDNLPTRIMSLFNEFGVLHGDELIKHCEIDENKLADIHAFVESFKVVKAELIKGEDLAKKGD